MKRVLGWVDLERRQEQTRLLPHVYTQRIRALRGRGDTARGMDGPADEIRGLESLGVI